MDEPLDYDDYSQTYETYFTFMDKTENWNNLQFHSIDKKDVPDSKIWYLFDNHKDNNINSFNDTNQGNFSKIKLSFDVKKKLEHFEMSIIMREVFKIETNNYIYPYDYRNKFFKDIPLDDICSTIGDEVFSTIGDEVSFPVSNIEHRIKPEYMQVRNEHFYNFHKLICSYPKLNDIYVGNINYFYLKKNRVYYSIYK